MKFRNFVRTRFKQLMNEALEIGGVVGSEIISHLRDLPTTRGEVNWSHPRIMYSIPDLQDGDAMLSVFDKEQMMKYVADFEKKFGETPKFEIMGRNISVLNKNFNEWRTQYGINKDAGMKAMGTTD